MSDPRIALIAEGPTDFIIMEAALKAVLQRPFVLTPLQPEPTRPDIGNGWGGVFKWCQEFRLRGAVSIEADPTLSQFDLVVVHLDADVAGKRYADYGPTMENAAATLQALPCERPCPPPTDTVAALEAVLLSWLDIAALGPKSVFCIPSKASDAWLAAAVLPAGHALLTGLECHPHLEAALSQLPKGQKLRKTPRDYRSHAGSISQHWKQVQNHCLQARVMEQQIQPIAQAFPA
ncbi:hypothetical protein [Candidatus Symbiobacter mobilis]|uniref:Uncharacterized protein n=1 Tax=Candidatus Symbiobacter mobilis CR TaxID=946483 RepID=U5N919_9BURK|nr:hypothetical protein [Candidatus Symbiobacter mobilis]AGX86758.1 hypothetical protein Cenrod_0650 [Candidatus Symbiobacter mobilis CR]